MSVALAYAWPHVYEGPKRRRYLSDAARAMRARRKRGAGHATADVTYQRVTTILAALDSGAVSTAQTRAWATLWDLSGQRVEQLLAEARRTRKRIRRLPK